jgi:hypothetical protein
MNKRIAATWIIAVLLCTALASLLQADGAVAPFHITDHDPWTNEVGVALNANVYTMFDDDVNPATVTNDTFVVHGHLGGLASGTLSYDAGIATLTLDPDRAFHAGEVLRVSATSGISSTGGAGLAPYGWQFTAGHVSPRCGTFTDAGAGLTGVHMSAAAWGDYDNDGDLDILLTGMDAGDNPVSKVYRNDGGGSFNEIGAGLEGVRGSSVAWGDYDNDGDLDILLSGESASGPVSIVYRNDGAGAFSDIGAGLTGVWLSAVAWGDYDNDGDLDILLTGWDSTATPVSKVYRNDGAGVFVGIGAGLTGVSVSSVAWGDVDNDGDLDILLCGDDGSAAVSKVYRNDGAGAFVDITAGLTGVAFSSVAWGDYDQDFDLDILLTGSTGSANVSKVYRNDGASGFTDIGAGLIGVHWGSVGWGDYDNDGDLDILLTGQDSGFNAVSKVYRNDGGGAFSDIGAGLTGVFRSSAAWGDYDNDRNLDILLTGARVSKVYRNSDCWRVVDHQPETHKVAVQLTAAVTATFDADVNASTVTSDTFVVHGNLGGLASGAFGYDAGSRTVTLDPGRAFHAGEVLRVSATSGIFNTDAVPLTPYGWQFTAGPVVERGFSRFVDIGAGLTGVLFSSAAWGDYDNDGHLDVLLTGMTGADRVSKVYRNDGAGAFSDIGAGLTGVLLGSVAWGDHDNDGDLDILLTGESASGPVSIVYRNDGAGAFSDIGAGLTGVALSAVAWGDYDNDGDLDILLAGYDGSAEVSEVYRNDGAGAFSDIGAGLTGVAVSAVAWGDYDNDGDLDILLTGAAGTTYVSQVWRNDGAGAFTDIGAGLTGVSYSSVAWGDYDNDGDLDILLCGLDGTHLVSIVYRNDGASGFTDIGAGLTPVRSGSVAWGDYDNDGDLDILLCGDDGANPVSRVYCNDGAGGFSDIGAGLADVWSSSAVWGDAEGDGDLDILLCGDDGANPVSRVYCNDGAGGFSDIGAGLADVWSSSAAWGDAEGDGDLDILLTGGSTSGPVSQVYRNNSRPELESVTPASGSGPVGVTTYFTTTWSDPDGWENLKQCYFHIGASPALAGNVTLLYNAAKDKLWLLDDSGTGWLGGCHPGDMLFVLNGQAILHCSQTTVQGAEDILSVVWAIEFRPGFEGAKKLGLKCKDRDKAKAKGKWKGTWTIE